LYKTCTKCKQTKLVSDFRNGKSVFWCKSCFQEYEKRTWKESKDRRTKNKEKAKLRILRNTKFVWDFLKQHPCESCGESDPVVLEFDHINPSDKKHNICDMKRRICSLKNIEEEISKCRILCANCHRRHTAKQQGWWSDREDLNPQPSQPKCDAPPIELLSD
jgi:hypothetical protein